MWIYISPSHYENSGIGSILFFKVIFPYIADISVSSGSDWLAIVYSGMIPKLHINFLYRIKTCL